MTLEELAKKQLVEEEGNVSYVYPDSEGYQTIGIGFLVDKRKGGGLFPEEIDFIFNNRFGKKVAELLAAFPWTARLDDVRRAALINMSYQLGVGGLSHFPKMLAAMQVSDWETASTEALDSVWAKQTPGRAKRMAEQIRTGVPQWR